jgi:hypothetical protein
MGAKIPPRRRRRPKLAKSTVVKTTWEPVVVQRRMRSKTVAVGALGALVVGGGVALAFSQDRHCVDAQQRVVAESYCNRTRGGGTGGAGYRWYYGGRVGSGKASGGSFERGGFGRFFGGFHGG